MKSRAGTSLVREKKKDLSGKPRDTKVSSTISPLRNTLTEQRRWLIKTKNINWEAIVCAGTRLFTSGQTFCMTQLVPPLLTCGLTTSVCASEITQRLPIFFSSHCFMWKKNHKQPHLVWRYNMRLWLFNESLQSLLTLRDRLRNRRLFMKIIPPNSSSSSE